jgi:hypothetical protein
VHQLLCSLLEARRFLQLLWGEQCENRSGVQPQERAHCAVSGCLKMHAEEQLGWHTPLKAINQSCMGRHYTRHTNFRCHCRMTEASRSCCTHCARCQALQCGAMTAGPSHCSVSSFVLLSWRVGVRC